MLKILSTIDGLNQTFYKGTVNQTFKQKVAILAQEMYHHHAI
jgi:hypothetical protein